MSPRHPTPATYPLCIERADNSWIAYVPTLPGCFAATRDDSPQAAIDAMPQAIAAWYPWAGVTAPVAHADTITTVVAEQHGAWLVAPDDDLIDEVNAFFAADRPALSSADVDLALDLLQRTRADLLTTIAGLDDAALAHAHPNEWSILQTLLHLGGAEWWYLDRLDLAFPQEQVPDDPYARLDRVRTHLREVLPTLIDDQRIMHPHHETWSPRKLLRRALWHERDHTQHIQRLRTLLPPNLAIGG